MIYHTYPLFGGTLCVYILDITGYSFLFYYGKVKLYQDSILIRNGMLSENLYKLIWLMFLVFRLLLLLILLASYA